MVGRDAGLPSSGAPSPLADGEGWLRSLLRNTADVVTVLSADNTVLYDSPAIGRVFGYAPGERVGENGLGYVHPDDAERVGKAFAELLEGPRADVPLEYRMRHKDGSWRYVASSRTNLLDDPSVGGVVTVYRDVTGRKEAEDALRESEERYRAVVEQSAEAIWLFDPDTKRVLESNASFQELLGYTAEELLGMTNYDFVTHSYESVDRVVARKASDENSVPEERVYRRKDGTLIEVEVDGTLIRYRGNEVVCSVARDLTERRKAEEAVRESEERFRSLVQNASDMISILNPDGTMRYVSPSVERVLGYRPEERIGADAFGAETHPDDAGQMREAFAEGLGRPGGVSGLLEFRVRRKDGSWRRLEAVATNRIDDAAIRGIVVNARDVTERKEAEERLRKAEEGQRRRARDLELLHRARTALSGELDPREVLRAVVEAVAEAYGYTLVSAYLLEGEGPDRELVMQHQVGYRSELRRIPLSRGVMARTVRSGEPVLLENAHSDPDFLDAIQGIVSEVCVPLLDGEDVVGTFNVESTDGEELTEDDLGLMVALGEHVGIALGRARLHERVRESEERFRTAFEDAPTGVALVGLDNRYLRVNGALCGMLGYEEGELLGKSTFELTHPEDLAKSRARTGRILGEAGPESGILEKRYVRKDGSAMWALSSVSLVRDSSGNPEHFVSHFQDLTERKEAEERLRKSEANLAEAQRLARLGSWEWDPRTGESAWSDETFRVLGFAPQEFSPSLEGFLGAVHPDDRGMLEAKVEAALGGDETFDLEHRLVLPDGGVRAVHCRGEVAFGEEGEPLRMVGTVHDVTSRKEAEEALKESEERYRRLVESSPEAVAVHDGQRVLYANPAAARLFGARAPSELVGREVVGFVHPDDRRVVASRVRAVLEGGEGKPLLEERYLRLDGSVVDAEVAGEPITYAGKPAVQVVLRDVTGRKRMEGELRHRATHDPLTALPNRRLLLERLRHALGRRGGEVALLFLDLDGFKVVNDSLGHEAGDRLLVAAAGRIGGALRPSDTVARLGGDEFVVLLEDAEREGAIRAAGRVLAALEAPFAVAGHELRASASVGIALGGGGRAAGPEELLREADLAMYRAKEGGKARHAVYDPSMDARARERLELRSGLLRALERGEFAMRYQPVVSLETGAVVGLEALLRWEHPERGTLPPAEFLAEAEDSGLAGPLLGLALGDACRLAADFAEDEGSPAGTPWVSVNLSPSRLGDPGLADEVARGLRETGALAGELVLEITEDAAMEGGGVAEATLVALEALGARVAIDDFGTGYSSLSHLERLPADFLKLDRAFVANLAADHRKAAVVHGMVDLAHALGLAVIAEGVETEGQLEILRGAGCDLAQGYLFAEPLVAEEATSLVAQGY